MPKPNPWLISSQTADSHNNIFGRTLNPHKTSLTAGGSSGGEGAIVSFRGSPLGLGTDIAGSIRIPALCCGIYSFKPSINRVPYGGQAPFPYPLLRAPGGVAPAAGPLGHSVDDLNIFMSAVIGTDTLNAYRYDSDVLPLAWRLSKTTEDKHLTIGILPEDPEYPLSPPVRRTLDSAAALLKAAGHHLIPLPYSVPSSPSLGARLSHEFYSIFPPPPDAPPLDEFLGEPLVPSLAYLQHANPFTNGHPVDPGLPLPLRIDALTSAREAYGAAWHAVWREHGLDVVLAPGAAHTAVPYDTYGMPVYTCMWNLIDVSCDRIALLALRIAALIGCKYPAGIIPFGKASKEADPEPQKAVGAFEPDCK